MSWRVVTIGDPGIVVEQLLGQRLSLVLRHQERRAPDREDHRVGAVNEVGQPIEGIPSERLTMKPVKYSPSTSE
jgi:hypothetical protein